MENNNIFLSIPKEKQTEEALLALNYSKGHTAIVNPDTPIYLVINRQGKVFTTVCAQKLETYRELLFESRNETLSTTTFNDILQWE